jgi:hypothetical protein
MSRIMIAIRRSLLMLFRFKIAVYFKMHINTYYVYKIYDLLL